MNNYLINRKLIAFHCERQTVIKCTSLQLKPLPLKFKHIAHLSSGKIFINFKLTHSNGTESRTVQFKAYSFLIQLDTKPQLIGASQGLFKVKLIKSYTNYYQLLICFSILSIIRVFKSLPNMKSVCPHFSLSTVYIFGRTSRN